MSLHSGLRPTPSYWLLHSYLQHFSSDLLQRRDPAIVDVIHLAASALSAQGDAIAEPGPRTLHVPVNRIERQVGCGRNTVLISVHDPHSSCPSWRMGDQALMRAVASLCLGFAYKEYVIYRNSYGLLPSPFGLGGSVYSTDIERAKRVASRIETGMVFINYPDVSWPDLPFGGVKRSGYGKELSNLGLEEFVNKKLVLVPNIPAQAH
jgi:aldehyde dehydrogenase family protein